MYKSEIETCSTESATNASSSQHLEIETSYMSNDTSRLVKKKKTTTKALVKRLLGVVGDLSSKVDRVLQKKDEPYTNVEPNRGFREEEEVLKVWRGNLGLYLRMLSLHRMWVNITQKK
ncbi:unnamed protein product [Lactuca saligna]|uniref:Uncharacterized protein n=1 Tax=Lactuca saligna TaxID=75948 RepID=A0AA35YVE9_LACSI|nr:unnamed protein product [Lactuca saligna]